MLNVSALKILVIALFNMSLLVNVEKHTVRYVCTFYKLKDIWLFNDFFIG